LRTRHEGLDVLVFEMEPTHSMVEGFLQGAAKLESIHLQISNATGLSLRHFASFLSKATALKALTVQFCDEIIEQEWNNNPILQNKHPELQVIHLRGLYFSGTKDIPTFISNHRKTLVHFHITHGTYCGGNPVKEYLDDLESKLPSESGVITLEDGGSAYLRTFRIEVSQRYSKSYKKLELGQTKVGIYREYGICWSEYESQYLLDVPLYPKGMNKLSSEKGLRPSKDTAFGEISQSSLWSLPGILNEKWVPV